MLHDRLQTQYKTKSTLIPDLTHLILINFKQPKKVELLWYNAADRVLLNDHTITASLQN